MRLVDDKPLDETGRVQLCERVTEVHALLKPFWRHVEQPCGWRRAVELSVDL